MDSLVKDSIDLGLKAVALLAIVVAAMSMVASLRGHLFTVYKDVMALLDEVRDERALVYQYSRQQYKNWKEVWSKPEPAPPKEGQEETIQHKAWREWKAADRVARSFDKLGLLVREGKVPVELISQFYVTPILKCWFNLEPYIGWSRSQRSQPGHCWEFENLAVNLVAPEVDRGDGSWAGIKSHELLQIEATQELKNQLSNEFKKKIITVERDGKEFIDILCLIRLAEPHDSAFNPTRRLWKVSGMHKILEKLEL